METPAVTEPDAVTMADESTLLRRRAEKLANAVTEESAGEREEAVIFQYNGAEYAVPLGQLSEIRRLEHLTPIPRTGSHIAGVTNIRNRIVAVYRLSDAETSASQDECLQNDRLILAGYGKAANVALLADNVLGTRILDNGRDGHKPVALEKRLFISGVDTEGRIHIDIDRIPDDAEYFSA